MASLRVTQLNQSSLRSPDSKWLHPMPSGFNFRISHDYLLAQILIFHLNNTMRFHDIFQIFIFHDFVFEETLNYNKSKMASIDLQTFMLIHLYHYIIISLEWFQKVLSGFNMLTAASVITRCYITQRNADMSNVASTSGFHQWLLF